jgi:hydroxyacylglutathione hydrolase
MPQRRTIDLGGTNCYLIGDDEGFVLIDTGLPHSRAQLLETLDKAGCHPADLRLIVLTHGDIDHSGNAAYLRGRFGAPIAMHSGDTAMCLSDGETRERDARPPDDFPKVLYLWLVASVFRYFARKLLRREAFEPFSPDILLSDGEDLRQYGLAAIAYHTPGHSKGSISLLTPGGDLYCGDHFAQVWGHVIGARDDSDFPSTSDKLRALRIRMVYPGHGEPFSPDRTKLWLA